LTTFEQIFVPPQLSEVVSDRGWFGAMIEAERALAQAESLAGVIPAEAAAAIAAACRPEQLDPADLAAQGRSVGNPAEPLVRALRDRVGGELGQFVHWGATSQDIVDTAAMLVTRRALGLIVADLDSVARACAALAERHRATPMAARTLLQHAVPTTFGLKAAGWLVAVVDARGRLVRLRDERLAAQLGGAGGTLAALGDRGLEVLRLFAAEVELAEPPLPWHSARGRVAELGVELAVTAGVLAKVALDVALLSQTEVAEVAEADGGGSSTMPQKQNPVASALAAACARHAAGYASVLVGALPQEHERAAGAWQAEWGALTGALSSAGGAAAATARALEGLEVDAARMRENLDAGGGAVMAERLSFLLAGRIGRTEAQKRLAAAARRAAAAHRPLRDELSEDESLQLEAEELETALDPATYLGSADTFVERALEHYREGVGT
jgi:3-carboxy-cis,cis-muconate cycloisomerase